VIAVAAELGDIHPGAERRPGPRQDDAPDPGVVAEAAESLGELDPQLDRERVALLGALQGDERHLAVALDRQQLGHCR
jgi:hypothetical protein